MTAAAFLSIALIHLMAVISPGPSFVMSVRTAASDGLRTGLGVRYVGKTWADKENTLHVPSYALVDALIGYDLGKLGMKGLDLSLNANNLLDEDYVASCYSLDFCYFGEKRNVTATLSYQF